MHTKCANFLDHPLLGALSSSDWKVTGSTLTQEGANFYNTWGHGIFTSFIGRRETGFHKPCTKHAGPRAVNNLPASDTD